MLKTRSRLLAWGITIIVAVNILLILVLHIDNPSPDNLGDLVGLRIAAPLVFSIVAALIIRQQPGNRVGWLLMLFAFAATNPISIYYHLLLETPSTITLGIWLVAWINGWSWIPMFFPIFLIPLHFPTGRPPTQRWNWVNRLALIMWVLFIFLAAVTEGISGPDGSWVFDNPLGFLSEEKFWPAFMPFWGIGLLTLVFTSIISLFVRYRRAKSREQAQIKWLLYGGAVFAVNYAIAFYYQSTEGEAGDWILSFFFLFSILAIPISIGIAILRNQLYDIDIIIRRTLVYAVLTAALGVVYFGTVVIMQTAVGQVTDEQSPLVIVFSTLLIAALFAPLRRRIQSFIDRRFYRRKYDAAQILTQFAVTVRDEVELYQLTQSIQEAVQQTLEPAVISVWIPKQAGKKRS